MCQCVIYNDKKYCTQEELRGICPEGLAYINLDLRYEPQMCLCPVDLRLTGEDNGYDVDEDSDPFDVIFTRKAGLK